MKKTIIALIALAGVAAADTLTLTSPTNGTLTSGNAAVAWSEAYTKLDSWQINFTLTDATVVADSILFSTARNNFGSSGYLLSTNANGSLKIHSKNISGVSFSESTAAGIVTAGTPTAITLSFVADFNQANEKVGGTFTVTSGDVTASWAVTAGLDSTVLLNNNNSGSHFWTNGGAEQFSGITVTKLDNNMVVPEPTTATLSLLALVGLAARRRRK